MKKIFKSNGQLTENAINALNRSKKGDLFRPMRWINKGRTLQDDSQYIKAYLESRGVMFECGNDSVRGGKEGFYIKPAQEVQFS